MKPGTPLIKKGWIRALLYAIAAFFILQVFQWLGLMLVEKISGNREADTNDSLENFLLTYGSLSAGVFLFTWLFRKFIDRKSFKSLGFEWRGSNDALIGFFTGPAILGLGSLILVIAGYLSFIDAGWHTYPLFIELLIFLLAAFTEELLVRGYFLNNLMQSINKWIALLLSSVLFAFLHGANPGISVVALLNIFGAGFFLGINYIYTKNLWYGIFLHFSWNFFQGAVLGYEVSGFDFVSILQQTLNGPVIYTGVPFGFEGSIVCLALLILATVYLAFVFSRRYGVVAEVKQE
jgi:membrane protease YdiL (CAAX protease family)